MDFQEAIIEFLGIQNVEIEAINIHNKKAVKSESLQGKSKSCVDRFHLAQKVNEAFDMDGHPSQTPHCCPKTKTPYQAPLK
ncbi:MAG: hypothetical protein ACXVB1_10975 [Pseudobdellovibrionaceae bacterium]